jgi:hypothetical protein
MNGGPAYWTPAKDASDALEKELATLGGSDPTQGPAAFDPDSDLTIM